MNKNFLKETAAFLWKPLFASIKSDSKQINQRTTKNKWIKQFDERPHTKSCRYWELNEPLCCVHRSRDSQCFSMARTTPKIAPYRGGSRISTPSNTWLLGLTRVSSQTASRSVQPCFIGLTNVTNRRTLDKPAIVDSNLDSGAATWRTRRNLSLVLDSGPWPHYVKTWRQPQNGKYINYLLHCCQRRTEPRPHVTRSKNLLKFAYVFLRCASGADRPTHQQTYIHADRNTCSLNGAGRSNNAWHDEQVSPLLTSDRPTVVTKSRHVELAFCRCTVHAI